MSLYRLICLLSIACTVNATPLLSMNVCPLVTDVIGALRDYPPASTFCSSFIGIETSTITATSTITPADVVVTSSVTETASTVSTTSTISSMATFTSTTPVLVTPTSTMTITSTEANVESCFSAATTLGVSAAATTSGVAGLDKRRGYTECMCTISSTSSTVSSSTSPMKQITPSTSSTVSSSTSPMKQITPSTSSTVSSSTSTMKQITPSTSSTVSSSTFTTKQTTSSTSSKVSSSKSLATSGTIPAELQSWASGALSTACSCLSLPTPSTTTTTAITLPPVTVVSTALTTVTPTTTISTTVISTVTQFISSTSSVAATTTTITSYVTTATVIPTGLAYYYYYPEEYDSAEVGYANVPNIVDSVSNNPNYLYSGTVQNINTISTANGETINLPNSSNQAPGSNFALIFQGYLYASAGAGSYSIVSNAAVLDDTGLVWHGTEAYGSSWNFGNADYVALYPSGGSVTLELADGEAVPITIFYANENGPGASNFDIVTPDGTVHTDTTPFFVGACPGAGLFEP